MISAFRHLLNISAESWLQGAAALAIGALVLYLVAELVVAMLFLMAVLSLIFAAAAFVKSLFFANPETESGRDSE